MKINRKLPNVLESPVSLSSHLKFCQVKVFGKNSIFEEKFDFVVTKMTYLKKIL
jgi:hypothetical protein